MPAHPNPELHALYRSDLGDIWEAARAAGVKPGTIRVWESRGKIERIQGLPGDDPLYHLPTVKACADAGKKFTPSNPGATSRGPHRHTASAA